MAARKVIITCAVTGAIHTPSMSPHLPITAQEIAEAAIGAAEAGAAIVHLHARDPKDGRPDQTPEAFAPFLKVIKQRSTCVVNITTGGAATMTIDERLKPVATFKPEVASLNMGIDEFRPLPDARALQELQARLGAPLSRRLEAIASSRTPSPTSKRSSRPAPITARASRSSATTSAISTRSRISSIGAW